MEIVITTDLITKTASLITALGVIGGVVAWCIKFLNRQKQQDKELKDIRAENTLICCGTSPA